MKNRCKHTEALLAESDALELVEPEPVRSTVDDRVLEDVAIERVRVDGSLGGGRAVLAVGPLELPRIAALVVDEAGVVVALVEVLEDRREDFGLVVGQGNALGCREGGGAGGRRGRRGRRGAGRAVVQHVVLQGLLEERRGAEDVFVGGKDALVTADDERDDWGGGGSTELVIASEEKRRAKRVKRGKDLLGDL